VAWVYGWEAMQGLTWGRKAGGGGLLAPTGVREGLFIESGDISVRYASLQYSECVGEGRF
jgi:hypothetical protein